MKHVYDKSVEEIKKLKPVALDIWGAGDKRTRQDDFDNYWKDLEPEFQSFLKTHTLALIDAEIERVEQELWNLSEMKATPVVRRCFCEYCDEALLAEERCDCKTEIVRRKTIADIETRWTNHLTHLKEQRELIKKET